MTIDDLMLALKSIVHERDEVAEYLEAALAERDALKNRVAELEKAVRLDALQNADGVLYCAFCGSAKLDTDVRPENFTHAPDCIVRTIEGKR